MSLNHYPSRSHFHTLIRSNHSQLHGSNCHCIGDPLISQINNVKSGVLRKQNNLGFKKEERYLLQQKLALSELENRKLHEDIIKYHGILEQLERTNMELIQIGKIEQRNHKQDLIHLSQSRKGNFNSTKKQQNLINSNSTQQIEGQYIISFKKLQNERQQAPSQRKKSGYQSTYKKPVINLNYQSSIKKQSIHQSNQKVNPQNSINPNNLQSKQLKTQLQKAYLKIQQLQHAIKYSKQEGNMNNIIISQNQLLKLKLKNIEQDIISYQKSIKHYQVSIYQLQMLINDLKEKQLLRVNHQNQNLSIKNQNEDLKKQLDAIINELKAQKNVNNFLRQQIKIQKKNHQFLLEQNQKLRIDVDKVDQLKQMNLILADKLKRQATELNDILTKQRQYNYLQKQLYQIKSMLQSINLSEIQEQHKKILIENKSKISQLTQEVSISNIQLQKYKQQILLLQQKLSSQIADKQLTVVSLKGAQQQNSILQNQVTDLENSIDKYLSKDIVQPFIKTTITNQKQQSIQTNTIYFTKIKKSIKQIVSRLNTVQKRIIDTNE